MAGNMSRNKGQRGEREAAALLMEWAALVVGHLRDEGRELPDVELVRNLMQSRAGGYDVEGLDWLALEVKRHENLAVSTWWKQTLRQAKDGQVPCLMYRQNRTQWKFKMKVHVAHYGERGSGVSCVEVEMSLHEARKWFQAELYWRLV